VQKALLPPPPRLMREMAQMGAWSWKSVVPSFGLGSQMVPSLPRSSTEWRMSSAIRWYLISSAASPHCKIGAGIARLALAPNLPPTGALLVAWEVAQ
jgi:hypothetical protein